MAYPKLIIDKSSLKNNVRAIKEICDKHGIEYCAVVKVFHADYECLKILYDEGIRTFASSRILQIKKIKDSLKSVETMLIRIPVISELDDVVKIVDTCLISEKETAIALNRIAKEKNKVINVIAMYDLGDLREGFINRKELIDFCLFVEKELPNIHLKGIGTNLTCYGSIRPTVKNLTELVDAKGEIENKIDRKLEVISGGATTSVELLINNNMPNGINQLRIGGLATTPNYIKEFLDWGKYIRIKNVFSIQAEIIEIKDKPTYPIGEIVVDGFGNKIEYVDKGIRKRAIIALGKNDIGGALQLYPKDEKTYIVGGASDHTIIDINDSDTNYQIGDIMSFELDYESIMFAMQSEYLERTYIGE